MGADRCPWLSWCWGSMYGISDPGRGSPGWSACYGHLTVTAAEADAGAIVVLFSAEPLQPAKAYKDLLHRYAAPTLDCFDGG